MGSVTCLVGNESTYKSQLSRSFLSQAFRVRDAGNDPTFRNLNRDDPLGLLGQGVAVLDRQGDPRPVAVEADAGDRADGDVGQLHRVPDH